MMHVYYYQWDTEQKTPVTHLFCAGGALPSSNSPIWKKCNTSVMLVPEAERAEEAR